MDKSVDKELGTGAVKITPAHDVKDFELAKRHCLNLERVIDDSGRMICTIPELNGVSRFRARRLIEKILTEKNLWRGQHSHSTSVPLCSRFVTTQKFAVLLPNRT